MAAEQGHDSAQMGVGSIYVNGLGIDQDFKQANYWLTRSANQGNAYAQYNLGIIYDNGYGVDIDRSQAFKWYKRAAESGISQAQFNVGMFYVRGEAVEQDGVKAYIWISKAAGQGLQIAMSAKIDLGLILTPAELALAESGSVDRPDLSGPVINIPEFKSAPIPSD
jgi:hypothetical protein